MLKKYPHLFITLFASLMFIPFLGSVHLFDWDELNFAEASREMILTGNYSRIQINFEPFWEKPPLFFWMQVICMKIFGISEFSARLPNALCGIFTLNIVFYYGKRLVSEKLGLWWILLFIGSFTSHLYFKSGIIDPWFNLFVFLAVIQLYLATQFSKKRYPYFLLAGLLLGLAVLTKGPVALLIVGLCGMVYWMITKFKPFFTLGNLLVLGMSIIIFPLLWVLPDWINNGPWFIYEFSKYQLDLFLNPIASHGQPWYFHPIVLLLGCFPAAIIAIPILFKSQEQSLTLWMKIMFWVVLILFSLVTTKIIHYSSLCYLPLTFIGALGLCQSDGFLKLWQKITIGLIGFIYSLAFIIIPIIASHSLLKNYLEKIIHDDFVIANLTTPTAWMGWEWILGLFFLILIILCLGYLQKSNAGISLLLIGNALFLIGFSALVIPKVEHHIQGSIITFYKSLQTQDVYIETVGFKSYAHYYYPRKNKPSPSDKLSQAIARYFKQKGMNTASELNEQQRGELHGFKKHWLLDSVSDKPIYLVYKITHCQDIDSNPNFRLIMNKGGFKVFMRKPKAKSTYIPQW